MGFQTIVNRISGFLRKRSSRQREYVLKICQIGLYAVAVAFFCSGLLKSDFSPQMLGVLFVWLAGILFCMMDFRKRLLLLSFDITIFVFLISRPLIDIFKGATRWHYYETGSVAFAIWSIAISLTCLQLGACLYEKYIYPIVLTKQKHGAIYAPRICGENAFRKTAFLLYLVCMVAFAIRQIDAMLFMHGRPYTDYYTQYTASYPSYVYTISEMMPYALCIYLATFPKKGPAFFALFVYVLSSVPYLIIGMRNPIVLNVLFAFLYYCMRDLTGDGQKWIGRFEKICIIICAPLAAFALSILNYTRSGSDVQVSGFFEAIVDLLYKQGVSFDVLCMGHAAIPYLPGGKKCYIFGGIIDQFTRGTIGKMLFHTTDFPTGNSEIRAIEGNSFAHSMSYVAHPRYLEGEGWGSSYLLETFADLGWIGVVIYSLLLGMLLIWMIHQMKGNWFVKTMVLIVVTDLLFTPRAEATGWLGFITTIHFWFIVFACIIGTLILEKIGAYSLPEKIWHKLKYRSSN